MSGHRYKGNAQWSGTCYGIDSQADDLVIVRGERTSWPAQMPVRVRRNRINCTTVLSDDPSFTQGIRDGAVVVGCLSVRESFTRWLEAPFPASNKAQKVFPTLLDVRLPFALEDCVYCFLNVSRAHPKNPLEKNTTRALAVAARLADVEKKLESFKALGIDPVVLDHEGLALWTQSLLELPIQPKNMDLPRVVIYMGKDRSTLVVGCGEEFLGAHSIRYEDSSQINRLLKAYQDSGFRVPCSAKATQGKQVSGSGDEEGFSGQVGNLSSVASVKEDLQSAISNQQSAIRWFLTGPGARDPELVKEFGARLSRDWPGSLFVHDEPETFLARALATRTLLPGPLRCNLRIGPLTHPRIILRSRSQSIKTALLFMLAGLLLCGINLTWGRLIKRKETQIDHAFYSLADGMAGYRLTARGDHALTLVRDKLDKRMDLLRPFLKAFEPSLTSTVSAIMEIGKKQELRYEILSLSQDKEVLISGTVGDWSRCEKLLAYLEQNGFTAKLDRKEALADGRVPFTITSDSKADPGFAGGYAEARSREKREERKKK